MFEVFISNAITVDKQAKEGTFGIFICTYTILRLNYKMDIKDMFPFLVISYLLQYVLKGKNSLNCFTVFGSSRKSFLVLFDTAI